MLLKNIKSPCSEAARYFIGITKRQKDKDACKLKFIAMVQQSKISNFKLN